MPLTRREAQQLVAYPNVTPVWLLPFLRLLKTRARGSFAVAYELLPLYLPKRVRRPSRDAVALVMVYHGLDALH